MFRRKKKEKKEEETEEILPLVQRIEEIRRRLFLIFLSLIAGVVAIFPFTEQLIQILIRLMEEEELIFTSPPEAFLAYLRIAFTAGILLISPLIIYQFLAFLGPRFSRKKRKVIIPFFAGMYLLFLLGIAFAYFTVIPFTLRFFLGFSGPDLEPFFSAAGYFSYTLNLILVFALTFQTPLILLLFGMLGLIKAATLKRVRKFIFLIIIILAAVITPPDGISQVMVALPLFLLFEFGILLVHLAQRKSQA